MESGTPILRRRSESFKPINSLWLFGTLSALANTWFACKPSADRHWRSRRPPDFDPRYFQTRVCLSIRPQAWWTPERDNDSQGVEKVRDSDLNMLKTRAQQGFPRGSALRPI